ncbi:MAG: hypothetical protein ACRD08_23065 [Acidimicrobiales bacterium]
MNRTLTLAIAAGLSGCMTEPPAGLGAAQWSGPAINLFVGADSTLVELPCRSGVVREPLVLDRDSRFTGSFTLVFHGGAAGGSVDSQPARLDARLVRQALLVTVAAPGPDFPVTAQLARRSAPHLPPCP